MTNGRAPAFATAPGFNEAVRELLVTCRRTWPAIEVDPDEFLDYLVDRLQLSDDPTDDAVSALQRIRATDLYLAFGCVKGDAAALAEFERRVLPEVAPALQKLGIRGASADETLQALRVHLLVAEGRPPRLAEYAGASRLARFVRTTAVRLAIDLQRRCKPCEELESQDTLEAAVTPDPQIEYLKVRYGAAASAALRAALEVLPQRARRVLRLHFVDGVPAEQLATLYDVHRTTVSRWIERWRGLLVAETHRALSRKLDLAPDEVESLMRLLESQVELSIGSCLGAGSRGH